MKGFWDNFLGEKKPNTFGLGPMPPKSCTARVMERDIPAETDQPRRPRRRILVDGILKYEGE